MEHVLSGNVLMGIVEKNTSGRFSFPSAPSTAPKAMPAAAMGKPKSLFARRFDGDTVVSTAPVARMQGPSVPRIVEKDIISLRDEAAAAPKVEEAQTLSQDSLSKEEKGRNLMLVAGKRGGERDREIERWEEMGRDGKRWEEMGRDGKTWEKVGREGEGEMQDKWRRKDT